MPSTTNRIDPTSGDDSSTGGDKGASAGGARFAPPNYPLVFATLLRNSLVRELSFRWNFVIEFLTMAFWFSAQCVLYMLIYANVTDINGWDRWSFFAFLATGMIVNTLIETFFMPNCANFGELIRTGNLDFVLLKPIDTQFLVSFERLELGALSNLVLALSLLGYALWGLGRPIGVAQAAGYIGLIGVAVTFYYSLMLMMASTSVWFGRNQGLYDFWFYITVFARYPRNVYRGSFTGDALRLTFSYAIPILVVATVPAELVTGKLTEPSWLWSVAVAAAAGGLVVSRLVFRRALLSYRSASS
jgi:ABC-2 type transport system permease protein